MRQKFKILLTLLSFVMVQTMFAQEKEITGSVQDASGVPLLGVNILVKGSSTGTQTDFDGNYTIEASAGETLVYSYVGFTPKEMVVGESSTIDVVLEQGEALETVVVTALGISREKKTLGYATETVSGDEVNTVTAGGNVANSLSGKVSGAQVRRNGNLGGSTNIILRGTNSLTGNNQALFVVDGVIIDNSNTNTAGQQQAGAGFDYGNASSDINPENIKTINVLKGAAATALYGSRASNGAIIITTKKGTEQKGLGVSVSTGIQVGKVNRETFPKYQDQYGGGYGAFYGGDNPYFFEEDINGDGQDDLVTPLTEDASYGAPFNGQLVYQWDAFFDPTSPNFNTPTPWKFAGKDGPISFFEEAVTLTNNVAVSGSNDKSSFRLNYSRFDTDGILPNSEQKKNTINFNGSLNLNDDLTATTSINYVNQKTLGRNGTGYSDNIVSNFRQWAQTNVNFQDQRRAYERTGQNFTWNPSSTTNPTPIFWDNPYFIRYENFQNDERNRVYGNVALSYDLADWVNILGRVTVDSYDEIQEERTAVGSNPVSKYSRFNRTFREFNYDLIANFDADISDDISFNGLVGLNIRRTNVKSIFAITNGGLTVPGLYSLANSNNPIEAPIEREEEIGVDGVYAQASFGFWNTLFLEGTVRRDANSTLPEGNNSYYYPSGTLSYVFSNNIDADWFSFGKFRFNYAEVGTGGDFASLQDTFVRNTNFASGSLFSVSNTRRNPDLVEERLTSYEGGFELQFFRNRLGLDISGYKTSTKNQIYPVRVTGATGYTQKFVNSGEIENKGVELSLNATPVKTEDFQWKVRVNWAKNENEVISLFEGTDNLVLGSFQGGVTLNATIGQPYGVIKGTDYQYDGNGNRVLEDGIYLSTPGSNNVIGDVNPDWTGGVTNTFTYKNMSLSFLIDVKQGGDVFSLDQYYGQATGLYPNTAGTNDLGNPARDPIDNGGGVVFDGVNADGSPNTTRVDVSSFGVFGYQTFPNAEFVYDASYVKLRELAFSYSLPDRFLDNLFINQATFTVTGSNLWIIHKNLPHADPEAGLSSGNLQGYQSGVLPTTRDIGFTAKFQF